MAEVLKKSIDPVINREEFPSNSHKSKEEAKTEKAPVKKVVKNKVIKQKPSMMKVITSSIFGEEVENVGEYLLNDVLIPAAKNTISDIVQSGIEMLLFGERRNHNVKRDGNRSYVSYNKASYRNDRDRDDRRANISSRNRQMDDITLETRREAEDVLSSLSDLVIDYGQATVADLYDLVGITSSFTDNKWGWTTVRDADIRHTRRGYLIELPKPRLLD